MIKGRFPWAREWRGLLGEGRRAEMLMGAGRRAVCPAIWTVPGGCGETASLQRLCTALQKFLSHKVAPKEQRVPVPQQVPWKLGREPLGPRGHKGIKNRHIMASYGD